MTLRQTFVSGDHNEGRHRRYNRPTFYQQKELFNAGARAMLSSHWKRLMVPHNKAWVNTSE